jgi:hypothetical protein
VHKGMERHEARDEKSEVSRVQEVCIKVSEVWEGMHLCCAWVHEGMQVMWEVGSSIGIYNEHEVT